MQLNKFTDYGLRLLMYLLQPQHEVVTIAVAAQDLKISENHLIKVTHFMAKQGWIRTTRGKGGGIQLVQHTIQQPIGELVRTLEHNESVIDCFNPACNLRFSCQLKGALDHALEAFYQSLNQYSLQDALSQPIAFSLKKDAQHHIKAVNIN